MYFNWFSFLHDGAPSRADNEFYGDRFSVPVIGANQDSEQTFDHVLVYDYQEKGWCYCGLPEGAHPSHYDIFTITHYGYLPQIVSR